MTYIYKKRFMVLIVDDDKDSRFLLKEILEFENIQTIECTNGKEGLKMLEVTRSIKLVFLDISLPDIDGWEIVRHIKTSHPTVPVIAISAIAYKGIQEKCERAGFSCYLSKPFWPKDLLEIIKAFV